MGFLKNKKDIITLLDGAVDLSNNASTFVSKINSIYKSFDSYYMQFLELRKQRDLIILNIVISEVMSKQIKKINTQIIKDELISEDLFITDNGMFLNIDFIEKFYPDFNKSAIEKIMELIKSSHVFIQKNLQDHANNIDFAFYSQNLESKISKIEKLTDIAFLSQISKNQDFISSIIDIIPNKILQYKDIIHYE
jgi:hypothetical protein